MLVGDGMANRIYLMNDAIGLRKEKEIFFGELAFIGVRLEDCDSGAFQVFFIEQGGEIE
jgi:hypothetical protein